MNIFVALQNGAVASYGGMSEEVVSAMLTEQGITFTFIDEATYINLVNKAQPLAPI